MKITNADDLRRLWEPVGRSMFPDRSSVDGELRIGVPPFVHGWLSLHNLGYADYLTKRPPLERSKHAGRSYYVLPIMKSALHKIATWWMSSMANATSEAAAVEVWFESIDPLLHEINYITDVVSLTPWCAKLIVAPEKRGCAWRRRKN